jgi:hypothetical protein
MNDAELLKDSDMDKIRAWLSVFSPDGYREGVAYLRGGGHVYTFDTNQELIKVDPVKIRPHRTYPGDPVKYPLLGLTQRV